MPENDRKQERDEPARMRAGAANGAPPPYRAWWRKRRRLTDGLIGLGSAAVLAVYAAGYVNTQHTESTFGRVVSGSVTPYRGSLVGSPMPSPVQGAGYRDGTWLGRGNSRHGAIQATVVIEGGKITSANVSGCDTRYSCDYVDPLVHEVIDKQVAPVDHISGATDSSRAYQDAVNDALRRSSFS